MSIAGKWTARLLSSRKSKAEIQESPFDTLEYWRSRYASGGRAGKGTYGRLGQFKAEVINKFVVQNNVDSVIELGCGDGDQFSLLKLPHYIGVDVSDVAIESCRKKFFGRDDCEFLTTDQSWADRRADLSMSLDVVFHLIEDHVFDEYMRQLFAAADRFVIIYSSNRLDEGNNDPHVRHRRFTDWIDQNCRDWALLRVIPNRFPRGIFRRQQRSFCDFYIYKKV